MKKIIFLFLLISMLVGCSNTSKDKQRLVFKEEMPKIIIDSLKIQELPTGTKIIFKLWGYDLLVADAKATLLNEYEYELSELPVSYGLDYRKEWDKKINPGKSGKYGYYITLEVKSGNNQVYQVDYTATDKEYFGRQKTNVEELAARIFIKETKKIGTKKIIGYNDNN